MSKEIEQFLLRTLGDKYYKMLGLDNNTDKRKIMCKLSRELNDFLVGPLCDTFRHTDYYLLTYLTSGSNLRWTYFTFGRECSIPQHRAFSLLYEQDLVQVKDIISRHRAKNDAPLSSRFDILKRDNYACQICGRTAQDGVKLEIDHKVPKSKGGKDTMDNLWTLCFDCNRGKSDKEL